LIEVLANDVTLEGMRRVKVVCDEPIDAIRLSPLAWIPADANRQGWIDELLGLFYLEATWPCREPISLQCEGWKRAREMVLWKLAPGERVSTALKQALGVYAVRFKSFPAYAFMRRLPSTIENGFEAEDMCLFEAEWVPAGCIAISEGEQYGFEAMALQK
jgi:hypothetical protein